MSIALRILLGYSLIVALAALLLGQVFLQQVKPGVRQATEDGLVDSANLLAGLAADDLAAGRIADGRFAAGVREVAERDFAARISGFDKRRLATRVMVTDVDGIVVFDSDGSATGKDHSRWNDVHRTLRGQYGARSTRADPTDDSSSVMHVAAPVRNPADGRLIGVLTVARDNRTLAPVIARSQAVVRNGGLLLLGAAAVIGLLAAGWLSRQVGALRRYADAVAAGERATPPHSAGEFRALGDALESMRRQLDGKQYVERYVQALTHELKSPLAAIRGSVELLVQDDAGPGSPAMSATERAAFLKTIGEQGQRMTGMIDKLLALSAVEHQQVLEAPQRLDLPSIIGGACDDLGPKARERGIILVREDAQGAIVLGDAFLLRQAIVNLLDNALDFAPRNSIVTLALGRDGDDWRLVVSDQGPGIPDFALPRIFERFYSMPRPDGGSRSSGIGLCFVNEVASLHGGSVTISNAEGGGTQAVLRLPAT